MATRSQSVQTPPSNNARLNHGTGRARRGDEPARYLAAPDRRRHTCRCPPGDATVSTDLERAGDVLSRGLVWCRAHTTGQRIAALVIHCNLHVACIPWNERERSLGWDGRLVSLCHVRSGRYLRPRFGATTTITLASCFRPDRFRCCCCCCSSALVWSFFIFPRYSLLHSLRLDLPAIPSLLLLPSPSSSGPRQPSLCPSVSACARARARAWILSHPPPCPPAIGLYIVLPPPT
jgi:hypothetical protein